MEKSRQGKRYWQINFVSTSQTPTATPLSSRSGSSTAKGNNFLLNFEIERKRLASTEKYSSTKQETNTAQISTKKFYRKQRLITFLKELCVEAWKKNTRE